MWHVDSGWIGASLPEYVHTFCTFAWLWTNYGPALVAAVLRDMKFVSEFIDISQSMALVMSQIVTGPTFAKMHTDYVQTQTCTCT